METILLNRCARVEQLHWVCDPHLQVGIQQPVIRKKVILILHRNYPAIREKASQCPQSEVLEGKRFLAGERIKIVGHSRSADDRNLSIDNPSKEEIEPFPPKATLLHGGQITFVPLGSNKYPEPAVHRFSAAQLQCLLVILLKFPTVIAVDTPLDLQMVLLPEHSQHDA